MTPERRVAADPRYRELVATRQRFAWLLTGLTVGTYTCFISLIAWGKAWLARPLAGGATTIAVAAGLLMLVFPVAMCVVYVRRAHRDFDQRLAALLREDGA